MDVEYRILGPLDVSVDGRPLALGGRHQRALLALLLAQVNEVVPVDRLIDGLWDEAPPETAANIVQGYVSQLRKLLGRETIVTRGRGYALIAADGALDLQRFEQRAAAGTAEHAAGRPEAAAAELRAALAVWRGPALSDLADLPAMRPIAVRLDELRLAALERRIGADLECGNAAEAAAELDPLIAEHPLRERLRALQMRALYRCGRQADALASYRAARETLVDELGLEPGAELQELERAILRRDPSLAPADGTPLPPSAPDGAVRRARDDVAGRGGRAGRAARRRARGELVLAATVPSIGPARARDERAARARRRAVAARRDRPRRRLHLGHSRQRPRAAGRRAGRGPAARRRARRAARGRAADRAARARAVRCRGRRRRTQRRAPGRCWSRSPGPSTTGRRSSSARGWHARSNGRCAWPARAPARPGATPAGCSPARRSRCSVRSACAPSR